MEAIGKPSGVPTFAIYRGNAFDRRETIAESIIKIGRHEDAQLRIQDDQVARMHAVIEVEQGVLTIVDLGTSAGTLVNGARVDKRELAVGDRITLGATTIVVEPERITPITEPRIPTPELVRDLVGDGFSPTEVFGVAAIVLHVDGIRREAWSDDTELGESLFESYPRGAIAPPELGVARSFKTIDDAKETRTQRCSTCVIRPGNAPCAVCLGSGTGATSEPSDRCVGCNGEGYLRCATCDGTTRVIACAIRYVNDEIVRIRRALVPAVHPSIRPFIEARIPMDVAWPDVHAFDPEPTMVASAYRGSSATARSAEDFHGYYFGDALAVCLASRADFTTGLARFEMRTFAVPIFWTVTHAGDAERHEAYFFDPVGKLVHVAR